MSHNNFDINTLPQANLLVPAMPGLIGPSTYAPIAPTLYQYTSPSPHTNGAVRKRKRKPRLFTKDIENLLFAMGDRPALTDATVAALEDVLTEYLVELCHKFQAYAHTQGRTRVKMNDLVFALRNDPLKLARLEYIVDQNDRIQRAKKMFEAKTGNFSENGDKGKKGFADLDDDDDEDDDERQLDAKGKKRKVPGNVGF